MINSITWSTVALVALVLPGFAFFTVLRSQWVPSDSSPRIGSSVTTAELALSVFAALVVHGVFLTLFELFDLLPWDSIKVVATIDYYLTKPEPPNTYQLLSGIIYITGTTLYGWGLGLVLSLNLAAGNLFFLRRFLIGQAWLAELIDHQGVVLANIQSTSDECGRPIMISGFVKEIFPKADGEIGSIVLLHAQRYVIDPGGNKRELDDRDSQSHLQIYSLIRGQHIAQISFERWPVLPDITRRFQN